MSRFHLAGAAVAILAATLAPGIARGETFNTCAGFIDAVPATLTGQGVWCMRRDLSTAIASGAAITIASNNITIDCNGFKLGGLAAGNASNTVGILASNRQNTTIRGCSIRGFHTGISLGGAGHTVHDNRLDNNLVTGIFVSGERNTIRGNQVFDTGGHATSHLANGIDAAAHVIDNTVDGVMPLGTAFTPYSRGIQITASGVSVRDNRVLNLVNPGVGFAMGITVLSTAQNVRIAGNQVTSSGTNASSSYGIYAANVVAACTDNTVLGFNSGVTCSHTAGNLP